MFCSNCGHKLEAEDKFCDNCGTSVTETDKNGKIQSNPVPLVVSKTEKTKVASATPYSYYSPSTSASPGISKNKKIALIASLAILVLIIGLSIFANYQEKQRALQDALATQQEKNHLLSAQTQANKQAQQADTNSQQTVAKSVVNVLCDDGSGGSGTIMTNDGVVLTNNHVIAKAGSCLVTLPDPQTGEPQYIYESKPVVVPDLSKQYDIAMLEIDNSYTDSDGKTWGDYPTTFPALDVPDCSDQTSQLGDSLKIYGYPVTSGGYNLTITEGIISSFSDDGDILTSAKIDSGNSGGLAIDQKDCFVGIPSAVVKGKYQNLGVIIPGSVIKQFMNEAFPQ